MYIYIYIYIYIYTYIQVRRSWDQFLVLPGFFSVVSDSSMCPGVDSASKNEYQVNPGCKGGPYHLHMPMSRNLGALTSWNPVGLFRPVMGQLYLLYIWHPINPTPCLCLGVS
jgi:hypothetical protein